MCANVTVCQFQKSTNDLQGYSLLLAFLNLWDYHFTGDTWPCLLTVNFQQVLINLGKHLSPLFSPNCPQLWQFYFGWSHLVVSGLYFVWLAFIKFVSFSEGTTDISWLSQRWPESQTTSEIG